MGPPYKSVECLDAVCERHSAVRRALLSSLVGAVRCPTFFDRQSVSVPRAEKQGELGEPVGFGGAALDAEMALGFSDGDIGARWLIRRIGPHGGLFSIILADGHFGGAGFGAESLFSSSHGPPLR